MDPHTRFNETPPGSPKSCMKGSRRLNFEEDSSGSNTGTTTTTTPTTTSSSSTHHHHHHHSRHEHHHHRSSGEHKKSHSTHTTEVLPQSPTTKRSVKTVIIKSPGSGIMTTTVGTSTMSSSTQCSGPTEIPFQFHLSQHYDNPPPPPNCTSNGTYEEERIKKLNDKTPSPTSDSEPTTSTTTVVQNTTKPESLYNNHADKFQQYDPQLVAIASKFVNEILEKAKLEVANKQQKPPTIVEKKRGSTTSTSTGGRHHDFFGIGRNPWYRRAHGAISKWVTNICIRAQNAMKT